MKMSNSNSRRFPRVGVEHYELAQPRSYDVITDINVYSGVSVCFWLCIKSVNRHL